MAIKPFNSVGGFSVGEVPSNVIYANGDITTGNANLTSNLYVTNTANVGNLRTDNLLYANGTPWDLQEAAGANTQIQFNLGNNFAASANFTYDDSIQNLVILGNANVTNTFFGNVANFTGNITSLNANLGNLATANFINVASNLVVSGKSDLGPIGNVIITGGTSGQVVSTDGTGNLSFVTVDAFQIQNGNSNVVVAANSNVTVAANGINVITVSGFGGNAANNITNIAGQLGVTGNITAPNFIGNVVGNISGNITIPGANTGVVFNDNGDANSSAGFTFDNTSNAVTANGNLTVNNANLGNLATANFINVSSNVTTSNLSVNLELSGNTANFSGNVIVPNLAVNLELSGNTANFSGNVIVPNLAVNLELSGNTANFSGNVIVANIIGSLANGTSNVKVYSDANVEITIAGNANLATFSSAGLFVAGNINSTTGNITSNGSVTANGVLNGANANVTGEAILGSVKTSTIEAPTGNITISAAGTNENIVLVPTGTGAVSVSGKKIIQLADPVNPTDAATKEYVDAMAGEGLDIHTPVRVESPIALTATYAQGGTTPTVDSITSGTIIDFGSAHGLSVNDGIVFTNSFNGLVGGEAYWVYSVPSSTSITVKDSYFGPEITTLTNDTSLGEPSRANPGVGATLTNAGVNAALQIDGVTLSTSDRVLVYEQTTAYENGVYTVTTVGDGSTAWVLTRATDFNKYNPDSPNGMSAGSYVFVTQGVTGAGESYVMTLPTGEVIIGTDNLTFTQFSAAGSYSAGPGINITGTSISANVDGVTTDIVGGNIVVKTSATLTTPNIGDATFSSLSWNTLSNGNVTANNLSIGNIANIGSNLTVGGSIQANANISSNANINGNNAFFTNVLDVGGNLLANNITSNHAFSTNTANISSNLVTSNATVNLELSGNTANFSGNITSLNANLGNLATANFFTGTLIDGSSNIAIPSANGNINLTAGGNTSLVVTATGANITGNLGVSGNFSVGSLQSDNLTANLNVFVGNTVISWGTVTTTAITANQTIASRSVSGVTGIEFLVKGIDTGGSKYSVATVTAVTDGSNVDFSTFGTVNLGGQTGSLAVNVVSGNIVLQVTPASSNSTVWTTQVRFI